MNILVRRSIIAAAVALFCLAEFGLARVAFAADLPTATYTKTPVALPTARDWTGYYVGGSLGGAWNATNDSVSPTGCFINPAVLCGGPIPNNLLRTDTAHMTGAGFAGGGQAGVNWQRERWVFGIEGDFSYVGINDSVTLNRSLVAPLVGSWAHSETDKSNWLGTFRGRIGVTATPGFLIYATGGLAAGQIRSSSVSTFSATADTYAGSFSDTRTGWTIGGGGEWMISPQWSIKAEYLYVDLGKSTYTDNCTAAGICTAPPIAQPAAYQTELHVHENIARIGFNFHFGNPSVLRY
jgi:outer membrane immunogenic protein